MENIQSYSVSIILWLIVTGMSFRYLYVNWKVFRLSYRNVLVVCIPSSLLLLLVSVWWSEVGINTYFILSFIASYIKQYKGRLQRTSLRNMVDDKYLLLKFPVQTNEPDLIFRTKVYFWYVLNDALVFSCVVVFGYILDNFKSIYELAKIVT